MAQRIRVASLAIGIALALAGCASGSGAAPSSTGSRTASPSTPADAAAGHAEAAAIVRDYVDRNDVAIARALNPPYDGKAWRAVDSGPVLAADAYDTKRASLRTSRHPKPSSPTKAPRVLRAYGSSVRSSDGQEPWVLAVAHRDAASSDTDLATAFVYVKRSTGWRLDASIGAVRLESLPAEAKPMPALTAAQRQAAADAVPVVIDAVATGGMGHVADPAPLIAYRKVVRADSSNGYLVGANCRPWGTTEGTDAATATVVGTDALRLTRVGSRTLAVLELDCRLDTYAQDGGKVQIPPEAARIEGDDGKPKDSVVRRSSLMILMSIPDAGKPKIISADGTYLIP